MRFCLCYKNKYKSVACLLLTTPYLELRLNTLFCVKYLTIYTCYPFQKCNGAKHKSVSLSFPRLKTFPLKWPAIRRSSESARVPRWCPKHETVPGKTARLSPLGAWDFTVIISLTKRLPCETNYPILWSKTSTKATWASEVVLYY